MITIKTDIPLSNEAEGYIKILCGKIFLEECGTSSNEHIWALGSNSDEDANMHEKNSEDHRAVAQFFKELGKEF